MTCVYHTSDWHLGHKDIHLKFRNNMGFTSVEDHDEFILENYAKVIKKRDIVYFHGDVAFNAKKLELVKQLPGTKILIMGNHDRDERRDFGMVELIDAFQEVHALLKKKGVWHSHAPIHESELYGLLNIHGHTHNKVIDSPLYFNACLENTNYAPIERQYIFHLKGYKPK
jgi:calcineurin-like phosphoesterase family protein